MNIVFTYLKARWAKDTTAAVELADYNPSFNNLSFAKKILDIKLTTAEYKLCYKNKDRALNKTKVIKYKTLLKKIDTISQRKTYCDKDLRNEDFEILNKLNYLRIKTNNDFSNSNISNVDLINIFWEGSKFINSDLRGTTIHINDADFSNANLDGAEIKFNLGCMRSNYIEKITIDAPGKKTIFNTLRSIDDKYSDIKIKLVKNLIKEVKYSNNKNIDSRQIKSFLYYIFSKEYYLKDNEIKNYVKSLLNELTSTKNNEKYIESRYLSLYLDMISKSFNDQEQNDFMLKNNEKFIQLITFSLFHNDKILQKKSRDLYDKYLKLEKVKYFYEMHKMGNDESIDWDREGAVDNNNIIIINRSKTIVISYNELNKMLFADAKKADTKWNSFSLYINEKYKSPDEVDFNSLFNYNFKIFKDNYNDFALSEKFKKLASKFDDYAERFNSAFIGKHIQAEDRLIGRDNEEQAKMYLVLKELIDIPETNISITSLKNEHYQQICDIFELNGLTNREKSKYLLCLAIIFVKYASNDVFGLGNGSPRSLKFYAYALINKAHELNKRLMGDDYYDFKSDLLGKGQETTETTSLFFRMRAYGEMHCASIFNKMIPPQWRLR